MWINEVCRECKLTKKAVEYYVEQGLIVPEVMENGYRHFSAGDVSKLKKIAVLRGLGISVAEIGRVMARENVLHDIADQKELELADLQEKQALIRQLACEQDWDEISQRLDALEKKQSIQKRLLNKFPGIYGKYFSLHFARFLDEPITTAEQQEAFETIIDFLDGVEIAIPEDLQEYLEAAASNVDAAAMKQSQESLSQAMADPRQYLDTHKEILAQYQAVIASEEYKASPAYRMQELMKQFQQEKGYNDVFIPAMRQLSPSYREYYAALMEANRVFAEYWRQQTERME